MKKRLKIINKWLLFMGISPNLEGYAYLKESILICFNDNQMINSITKGLYPLIAKNHDKKIATVERNIRHAISVACDSGKIFALNDIIGGKVLEKNERPTVSQLIALLVEQLSIQCI